MYFKYALQFLYLLADVLWNWLYFNSDPLWKMVSWLYYPVMYSVSAHIVYSFFYELQYGASKVGKWKPNKQTHGTTYAPRVTTLRRSNFPLKRKKEREGESLALLRIWYPILGYLLGLIDLDRGWSVSIGMRTLTQCYIMTKTPVQKWSSSLIYCPADT